LSVEELTYPLPVVSVQALLELARAYLALDDPGGARAVLRQANDILQRRPDLGVLPDEARAAGHPSPLGERVVSPLWIHPIGTM
jgi:hypothetical protein